MSNSRQLLQRPSPLANHWVAAGYYYNQHTGLVSPTPAPPTDGGSSSTNTDSTCIKGVGEYEYICPTGVVVVGKPSYPP